MEVADLDFEGYDFGFDVEEFEEEAQEVVEDDFDPEPPEEPICKRGEVWQLGDHRLMVGDSTSAEDIKTLMDEEELK